MAMTREERLLVMLLRSLRYIPMKHVSGCACHVQANSDHWYVDEINRTCTCGLKDLEREVQAEA